MNARVHENERKTHSGTKNVSECFHGFLNMIFLSYFLKKKIEYKSFYISLQANTNKNSVNVILFFNSTRNTRKTI